MIKNEAEKTLLVGNLESVRVVLDVRDTVNAYYKLMINEGANGKIFNVCGDVPYKMGYYTDLLIKHSGLKGINKVVSPKFYRPVDIYYQHGDSENIKELTGWTPKYDLDTTMRDLLDYWIKKIS